MTAKLPQRETDLYQPIRDYLIENGYTVRSEVINCDITAVKDDDLIVIELKRSANIELLIQATERQRITDSVYVAIPTPKTKGSRWRGIKRVLRMLEVGLMVVSRFFRPFGLGPLFLVSQVLWVWGFLGRGVGFLVSRFFRPFGWGLLLIVSQVVLVLCFGWSLVGHPIRGVARVSFSYFGRHWNGLRASGLVPELS